MIVRLAAALALLAAPASAKVLTFNAVLDGGHAPTATGSKATGKAKVVVDTDTQTVSVALDVAGLTTDQLSTGLKGTPMGPIHLHVYGGHDHHDADAAQLAFPVPYGADYVASGSGFKVETGPVAYAKGAASVNSKAAFDAFVMSLEHGAMVLNIHTNRFGDGEISGDVVAGS